MWARISITRQRKVTKFQLNTKTIHARNYTGNPVSEPVVARIEATLIKTTLVFVFVDAIVIKILYYD